MAIDKKIIYTEYVTDDFLTAEKVNEIQLCIQADENAIEAVEARIQETTSYSKSEIDDKLTKKVDAIDGKILSTNDYTDVEKAEVAKVKDKQDALIFDTVPTVGSKNVVNSGTVYSELEKVNTNLTSKFETDDSYYDWRFKKLEARLKKLDNQDPDYSRQAKQEEESGG